jgi:hypothetical protein
MTWECFGIVTRSATPTGPAGAGFSAISQAVLGNQLSAAYVFYFVGEP